MSHGYVILNNEDVDEEVVERAFITSYVGSPFRALVESNLKRLPMYKAAVMLRARLRATGEERPQISAVRMAERYLHNKRIIEAVSAAYGIHTVFVWQPNPVYKYDLKYHKFSSEGASLDLFRSYPLYAEMSQRKDRQSLGRHFLWCADIQENIHEPLYVDSVHYSPKFSAIVAQCVYDLLPKSGFIDPRGRNP